MQDTFYRRFGKWFLIGALVAFPFAIFGSLSAIDNMKNRVQDWLPDGFAETRQLDWFRERFGFSEMLAVTWDGCTLDNPQVEALAAELKKPVAIDGVAEPLFGSIVHGPEFFDRMTSEPFNLSDANAIERMDGWLIGEDGRTTCLVVIVSPHGSQHRHDAVDYVYTAGQAVGLTRDQMRLAGPTIDSVAIDRTSKNTTRYLNLLCWGIALTVATIALRYFRIAGTMFVTALLCQWTSLAIIFYSGGQMSSILMMVASLTFVLSVSAGVHLVNYYRDAILEVNLDRAPLVAVRHAWVPCWLAAGTTAIGMGSLTVSKITPIYSFGIYSACGVMVGLSFVMLILPSIWTRWPATKWADPDSGSRPGKSDPATSQTATSQPSTHKNTTGEPDLGIPTGGPWRIWAHVVIRMNLPITVGGVALLVISYLGILRLTTSVNLHDMFDGKARVIQDYDWLQAHIGPMIPMDVVIEFPQDWGDDYNRILREINYVEEVRAAIGEVEHVGATLSAATFGPDITRGGGVSGTAGRTAIRRALEENRHKLQEAGYLNDDPQTGTALWRINVRVEAQQGLDYGSFIQKLEEKIKPLIDRERESGVKQNVSGGVSLVALAQRQLLEDLKWSFVTAFILVGITMIILLRSISAGIVSMMPNILPSVISFGILGWSGVFVDIGAMMTASVALGIAVDDTLHFITWFNRGLEKGYDRKTAVLEAYQRCGTAMTQTSLICGLGLLAYSISPFMPIARFSWMMFLMLFAALLGDLILLPALLAGPLGRVFQRRHSAPANSDLQTQSVP